MAVWGADVAGLQAVASDLRRYADIVERARASLDGQLARTAWQGQNADDFRWHWRTVAVRDLEGFRADCVATASELVRQAQEQLDASSSSGAGGPGSLASLGISGSVGQLDAATAGNEATISSFVLAASSVALRSSAPLMVHAANELFWSSGTKRAETAINVILAAVERGVPLTPGGPTASASMKASAKTAGPVIGGLFAYYGGASAQAEVDVDRGFTDAEMYRRTSAAGAMRGAVYLGVFAVASAAGGPLVGKIAASGASYAMENTALGRSLEEGSADLATDPVRALRRAPEGYGMMLDATVDLGKQGASWAGERGRDAVRLADQALDEVGGRVSDATSRFRRFTEGALRWP